MPRPLSKKSRSLLEGECLLCLFPRVQGHLQFARDYPQHLGRPENALIKSYLEAVFAESERLRSLDDAQLITEADARREQRSKLKQDLAIGVAKAEKEDAERQRKIVMGESNSESHAKSAAANRKKLVTKAKLENFRDRFEGDKGTLRGWKKGACLEFEIDTKTLNKRMAE